MPRQRASYGPNAEAGSPVAAARLARKYNIENARSGKQICLINVEKELPNFVQLRHNLAPFGDVAVNLHGEFAEQLPDILKRVGRYPVLFFLDSFGLEALDVRVVDQILHAREGRVTELLLHFSDVALLRGAGKLHAKTQRPQDAMAMETSLRNMDEMLGTRWWRGVFLNDQFKDKRERCDEVARLYMQGFEPRRIRHVHQIRMRDRYDDPPKYRLIFASKSAHGAYLMSDVASRLEARLFAARWEGSFELQLKQAERAEQRRELAGEIHRWGLEQGTARPVDVYCHFGPLYFGQWTLTDYDQVIREVVDEGGVDRPNSRGIKTKEQLKFVPIPQEPLFGGLSEAQ